MIKYFLLLISFVSCAFISADPEKKLCTKNQCSKRNAEKCSCYCSIKCGPRQIKPEDTPEYDAEAGQCFCRPRDKMLYEKNSCHTIEEKKLHKYR